MDDIRKMMAMNDGIVDPVQDACPILTHPN
jgi:hypothetical protein